MGGRRNPPRPRNNDTEPTFALLVFQPPRIARQIRKPIFRSENHRLYGVALAAARSFQGQQAIFHQQGDSLSDFGALHGLHQTARDLIQHQRIIRGQILLRERQYAPRIPLDLSPVPPLHWWRRLSADAFTTAHVVVVRRAIAGFSILSEPRWPDTVRGEAATTIGVALRTVKRRDTPAPVIDLLMSAGPSPGEAAECRSEGQALSRAAAMSRDLANMGAPQKKLAH
jgi:hypothetical protein